MWRSEEGNTVFETRYKMKMQVCLKTRKIAISDTKIKFSFFSLLTCLGVFPWLFHVFLLRNRNLVGRADPQGPKDPQGGPRCVCTMAHVAVHVVAPT